MKPEIRRTIEQADTTGWKKMPLEFGEGFLEISVPPECDVLSMKDVSVLADPRRAIEEALSRPIGCPSVEEIIRRKRKPASKTTVAVTVSDITRPVPYKGETGILIPLLKRLEGAGVRKQNITLVIGTGTHRPSSPAEKKEMFGEPIVREFPILDHDCEDLDSLSYIGKTYKQTDVYVNTAFCSADVRIVTGLVESHFMAGVSGGRKGVCPALVDTRTIEKFHGPAFLESPYADNLILDGNPCHEEALDVARTVGVDFTVNVTLDKDMRLTGVFAGHLEEAHMEAFQFMKGYTAIPLDRDFDIVLTHGGYVGRNHYQTAKAACAALPAVKTGGTIIIAADNRDREPIGSPVYRDLSGRLKALGVEGYVNMIRDPAWSFTKDQWEPEVWGRVLRKVGEAGLIYCSLQIPPAEYSRLPGRSGHEFLEEGEALFGREAAQAMVQNALLFAVSRYLEEGRQVSTAVIREGPYAVPYLQKSS
ncbi:MAG: nickel-dependent lactate racemase [Candidatus Aminicenantales bacterium]